MHKIRNILVCLLIVVFCMPNYVYAKNTIETTYMYDDWIRVVENIPFFEIYKEINQDNMGDIKLSSMDDVSVAGDRIYIVDSVESRVNVFDKELELIESIKLIRTKENKIAIDSSTNQQVSLGSPEGIFIHGQENEIYIADTGNQRIVVLNEDDFTFKRIINRPKNMVGQTVFNPSKIVVDRINRIYVVVQSGFEGLIELEPTGEFSRYFGVNNPVINILEYFWREQASEEQRARMDKVLAPSFNNISLDQEGFIYATTEDSSAIDNVFRFNPKGENVLRDVANTKIMGDYSEDTQLTGSGIRVSKFIDIAVTDYGAYALLDREKGRIFIYSFDGELMNIFGGKGHIKGQTLMPTSIDWIDGNLIVTDKQAKTAYIYKQTDIGKISLQAAEAYYNGEWDKSTELLLEAVSMNRNYLMAYTMIGKSYLMKEDYETAMYYFELAGNSRDYSAAFNGYRAIWVQDNFIWLFSLLILAVGGIIFSEVRYHKKKRV